MTPGTMIVVTDASGTVLTTTVLGIRSGNDTTCTFPFTFSATRVEATTA